MEQAYKGQQYFMIRVSYMEPKERSNYVTFVNSLEATDPKYTHLPLMKKLYQGLTKLAGKMAA